MKSLFLRKHVLGDKFEMVAHIWWQCCQMYNIMGLRHYCDVKSCAPDQPHALQMVYIVPFTAALFPYKPESLLPALTSRKLVMPHYPVMT